MSVLLLMVLGSIPMTVTGLEECADSKSVCPDGNTCCGSLGCISSNMGSLTATCCSDADEHTGCPKGYACAANHSCHATPSRPPDPLLQTLPRYVLCPNTADLYQIYGLPLDDANETLLLPYYSSHGSITTTPNNNNHVVTLALVVIHGGARNADDYYCPALAARQLQRHYNPESILVVAPRFLTNQDTIHMNNNNTHNETILRFHGTGHGKWRFGASAVGHANLTSFDALDQLIVTLSSQSFPNLSHIVVAGHSVGAQFVQRWSVLTSVEWNDNVTISAVVANPSSWTYLTPQRWIQGSWRIPPHHKCPFYNDWTWGLKNTVHVAKYHSPYLNRALHQFGAKDMLHRYRQRQVTYLAGSLDRCNVTGKHQWCQSHDLGTTCADEVQGHSRWDRHFRFVKSLRELVNISTTQQPSRVVYGVGHDHALMFTSSVGISALFPVTVASNEGVTSSPLLTLLFRMGSVFVNGQMGLTRTLVELLYTSEK